MVLSFTTTLPEALAKIELLRAQQFPVHPAKHTRSIQNSDEIIGIYAATKWQIIDILNNYYSQRLAKPFDLYNWLYHHAEDEVSYFLSEAGSNALNYSEFKAPSQFQVWLGKKGFIIGIEQQGTPFEAVRIHRQLIKQNKGTAFAFFRNCRSEIFFDSPNEAKAVYLLYFI